MTKMWSYNKTKQFDNNGKRWHFVSHYIFLKDENDEPFEIYFRNDERTEFGLIRFERRKDFPYRNYEVLANKIMNNSDFRKTLLNAETEDVWNKNWK